MDRGSTWVWIPHITSLQLVILFDISVETTVLTLLQFKQFNNKKYQKELEIKLNQTDKESSDNFKYLALKID